MLTLIKGGKIVAPGRLETAADILIRDGKIVAVREGGPGAASSSGAVPAGADGSDTAAPDTVIDARGRVVLPGLVDLQVHLREPGYEYKETIESGCRAAVRGGMTAVCAMPDTRPVNDTAQVTHYIARRAAQIGLCRVYPVAALSRGREGELLNEYGELKQAGAIALGDNRPVRNSRFMRRALEYARGFDLPVIAHCEEAALSAGGVMNEGPVATRLGLAGIPNAAESIAVMRDIALAELSGSRLHIALVSTREAVRAVAEAKKRGVAVSAATAPQYFTLSDEAVRGYDTVTRMNPPLRAQADVEAIVAGLADGTIDAIASDHAPQSRVEKELEFDLAADGIVGLETALSLSLRLVDRGVLSLGELVEKMAVNPARILGLECGLRVDAPADLTIVDLGKRYAVDPGAFATLGRNTPFDGWQLKGKPVLTMVNGKVVFDELT